MLPVRNRAWALVPAFVFCALPALAQSEGRISGTVRDALGAGVPGVALTITNQSTNATQTISRVETSSCNARPGPAPSTASATTRATTSMSTTVTSER